MQCFWFVQPLLSGKDLYLVLVHEGGTGKACCFQLAQLLAELLALRQDGDVVGIAQGSGLAQDGGEVGIMNELNNGFSGRNAVVDRLCRYPLLIIDDFGMERGTEYALEQVYNIEDSRYRSQKPLIVTTNLPLNEIRHPQDTARARIYDRILEMCVPISCIGASLRKENAQKKLESMKSLIG